MKKFNAFLLAFVVAFSFFGCSGGEEEPIPGTEAVTEGTSLSAGTEATKLVTTAGAEEVPEALPEEELKYLFSVDLNYDGEAKVTALDNYLLEFYKEYPIDGKIAVYFFDYDGDGIDDVLFQGFHADGFCYRLISNVESPAPMYDFSAFDQAKIMCDSEAERIVIRYFASWGGSVYATYEEKFLYLGETVEELSFVNFSGTSAEEEYYFRAGEGKTVLSREEWKKSVAEQDEKLTPYGEIPGFVVEVLDGRIKYPD